MSNYPQSYGSFQGYGGYGNYGQQGPPFTNSGPPPPPMGGMGMMFGAMNQAMNQAMSFHQSSYNNFTGYGGVPGYHCQAVQQMSSGYPMGNQPPPNPPQPPHSYSHQPFAQHQMEMHMQRQMYQQMGFKAPKPPAPPAAEGEDPPEEEPEEETNAKDLDEEVKTRMKNFYVEELLRRNAITSTLEMAQGTVVPMVKYFPEDIVVEFYKNERDTDLAGEDWDAEADCEYLNVAMKGPGTTEKIITHIVATRCNAQRQKLKKMFKTMYGKDLIEEIKSELSGDYKDAILACFVSPAFFDAKCIKKAIYGLGTDELALIEILMTRTNAQINEMKAVYGRVARPDEVTYETLIEDDIEGDTGGDFKRLLISCAQGNRYEIDREKLQNAVEEIVNANGEGTGMFEVNYEKLTNTRTAKRDAQRLFDAGEDRWGTDEETFNLIFATRDFYQLRAIYNQYVKIAQADIRHAVDSETSGDYRRGLKAVAQSVMNRPKYFAERLMKAMKGLGTDEETLIRIVASRSEIDMVQIKAEFLEMTHKTLYRYIEEDTSFNFKKILQALVGKN
ncbi:annexin-B12-like [Ruditapes philippinarum]|uniref:annexin-B12-like n=1 Tax=Ruditapes philippinarum TaxID=129788 RepID=UPI00295ADDDF|nr:annexin-B12-like [Ruditapes philippinarum]